MLKQFSATQVKYAFLVLSGWNLGGKEESSPTQLSVLHIPNPDQEALLTFDMNVVNTPVRRGPFTPFLHHPSPDFLTSPQINSAEPGFEFPQAFTPLIQGCKELSAQAQHGLKCVRGEDLVQGPRSHTSLDYSCLCARTQGGYQNLSLLNVPNTPFLQSSMAVTDYYGGVL